MRRLSARLQAVADLVVAGRPMVDVGTDHAALPCHCVASDRVPRAIAVDVVPGPLARAAAAIAEAGVRVELRAGSGLQPVSPGEVATAVFAGMGGPLIRELIDAAPDVVARLERLVLQPNTDWPATRRWIAQRGFALEAEHMVEDAGKFYVTFALRPGHAPYPFTPADLELGPLLRLHRPPVWQRWLAHRLHRLEHALTQLQTNTQNPTRLHQLTTLHTLLTEGTVPR